MQISPDKNEIDLLADVRQAYLDLMKKTLTNWIYGESEITVKHDKSVIRQALVKLANSNSRNTKVVVIDNGPYQADQREVGIDWPPTAHTMVGLRRLNNIEFCLQEIFKNDIPGDIIEAGVWRGGASIFIKAVLKAYGIKDRQLWLADSFAGLPKPNVEKYAADAGDIHHTFEDLAISLEQVKSNFEKYDLLDDQVHFLKGWFSETLPTAPMSQLALIRADGDMYESTMDTLVNLYPKLSVGGYVILDDFHNPNIPACAKAVHDFREAHGILDKIETVDWTGAYWKRSS
jgi:O-methyltransferase